MPPTVEKRDGSLVPWDVGRLTRSLERAARAAGIDVEADRARDVATAVELAVERRDASKPVPTAEVHGLAVRVLRETNRDAWAEALDEARARRDRRRRDLFVAGPPLVPGEEQPFSKKRLASSLVRERGIEADLAADVARTVEHRLLATGLTRVSPRLLSELTDLTLLARGLPARPAPGVSVPREVVRRAVATAPGPERAAVAIGRRVLTDYASREVLPEEVQVAAEEGVIDLGEPGFGFASVCCSALAAALAGEERDGRHRRAEDPVRGIRRAVGRARELAGRVVCRDVPSALLLGGASGRRGLRRRARVVLAALEGEPLRLLVGDRPREALLERATTAGWPGADPAEGWRLAREVLLEAAREAGTPLDRVEAEPGEGSGAAHQRRLLPWTAAVPGPRAELGLGEPAEPPGGLPTPLPYAVMSPLGVNLAQAAYRAGPGEVDAWEAELLDATDRALDAARASLSILWAMGTTGDLPLWDAGEEDPAAGAAPGLDAVLVVVRPVGLDGALRFLVGGSPGREAARRLGTKVLRRMTRRVTDGGRARGLEARLAADAPGLEALSAGVRRRLAGVDRCRHPDETAVALEGEETYGPTRPGPPEDGPTVDGRRAAPAPGKSGADP